MWYTEYILHFKHATFNLAWKKPVEAGDHVNERKTVKSSWPEHGFRSLNQWHIIYHTTQIDKQFLEYLSLSQLNLYIQEQMQWTWLRIILFNTSKFQWLLLSN